MAFRRWPSSLPSLGRLSRAEMQASGSSLVPRSAAVPDFLVPAFAQAPTGRLRSYATASSIESASSVRTVTQPPGSSTCSLSYTTDTRTGADFPSSFHTEDADVVLASVLKPLALAKTEQDVIRAAEQIYRDPVLAQERRQAIRTQKKREQMDDTFLGILPYNEHFFLALLNTAFGITKSTGKRDTPAMSWIVTELVRAATQSAHASSLSLSFLSRLAEAANGQSARSVLTLILSILQAHFERPGPTHPVTSSRAAQGIIDQDWHVSPARLVDSRLNRSDRHRLSKTARCLMSAFSRLGDYDRMQRCFELLQQQSLYKKAQTYQLQLIALCHDHLSRSDPTNPTHIKTHLHFLQQHLLALKQQMDADGVRLDDHFLTTIVTTFSAPLRSPSQVPITPERVAVVLDLVRSLAEIQGVRLPRHTSRTHAGGSHDLPRFFAAVLNVEVDAIQCLGSDSRSSAQLARAVRVIVHELETAEVAEESTAVGRHGENSFDEPHLAVLCLRLRMAAAMGDIDEGCTLLKLLLAIEPVDPESSSGQDLLLKQRSGVVALFSAAMRRRSKVVNRDEAIMVLRVAFDGGSPDFHRIWGGVQRPRNLKPGLRDDAWEASSTVLRLWMRWMHAWSRESLAHRQRRSPAAPTPKASAPRTFASLNPWRTMKDAFVVLRAVIAHYEADESRHSRSARRRLWRMWSEKIVLENIVRVTMTGGRKLEGKRLGTYSERRMDMLVDTFARVDAPARLWEILESSVMYHLSRIDPEELPTEKIVRPFDRIKHEKRKALLRNTELAKAFSDVEADAEEQESLPLENGSVTVLRHILKAAEHKKVHPPDAVPAFD